MTVGDLVVIAGVAALGFTIGFAARRWWVIAVAAAPSVLWLALTLPGWTEGDIHDNTGADWFLVGFGYIGAPVLVGAAAGIWLGRRVLPPKRAARH
jgi:hypothetical protein